MRITIDARMVLPYPTGIGRVVSNLVPSLLQIDQENEYTGICLEHAFESLSAENFQRIRVSIGQHDPRLYTSLPRILSKENPDLVHWHYFLKPLSGKFQEVLSVYDTIPLLFPHQIKPHERLIYKILCPLAAKRAKVVIADSEAAKQDIVKLLGVPEENIRVVYLGVESRFSPRENGDRELFRKIHNLPERYVCYIGNHKPHKNVPKLVQAFAHIQDEVPHHLVFSDGFGPDILRTKKAVEESGVANRTLFLRSLSDSDLPLLYSAAELFVFPSLYEGFGLPVLEAMACGTPVVSSNAASIPEVLGEAGKLVDARDVNQLADAMFTVLNNGNLRAEMSLRGIERCKMFSWEETARQTLNVYREVLGED